MPTNAVTIDRLSEIARMHLGTDAQLALLREASRVADSTAIYMVKGLDARSILQLSPAAFPDVVAEGCDRARSFVEAIGEPLSGAVVLPMVQGRIDGISYAFTTWRAPVPSGRFAGWIARRQLAPALLDWLEAIAGHARLGDAATYIANLRALADFPYIAPLIAEQAEAAIEAVERGEAAPLHVPMHGDLWSGNILLASDRPDPPFAVIDWRGSRVDGYPIYDLVRFAESFRLPAGRLRAELRRHATALGVPMADGEVQLLAALGHYARNLGEMPDDAFRAMAQSSFETHADASR